MTVAVLDLQARVKAAKPGDVIEVERWSGPLVIPRGVDGTAEAPITLLGVGDGEIMQEFTARPPDARVDNRRALTVKGGHWNLKDLSVHGGILVEDVAGVSVANSGMSSRGLRAIRSHDCRLEGSTLFDLACGVGSGVWITESSGWSVLENVVRNMEESARHPQNEGIRLSNWTRGCSVVDNSVTALAGPSFGISVDVAAQGNVFERNYVSDVRVGYAEQYGGRDNKWLDNRAERCEAGFWFYHRSLEATALDPGVPRRLTVERNSSIDCEWGLHMGTVAESRFIDNRFLGKVALGTYLTEHWSELGNVWEPGGRPEA